MIYKCSDNSPLAPGDGSFAFDLSSQLYRVMDDQLGERCILEIDSIFLYHWLMGNNRVAHFIVSVYTSNSLLLVSRVLHTSCNIGIVADLSYLYFCAQVAPYGFILILSIMVFQ